jgi:hypothetical protein
MGSRYFGFDCSRSPDPTLICARGGRHGLVASVRHLAAPLVLSIALLVACAGIVGGTPLGTAGEPDNPDHRQVVDAHGDHAVNPLGVADLAPSPAGGAADLWSLTIGPDTNETVRFRLEVKEIPFMPIVTSTYEIHFDVLGTPYVAEIWGRDWMSVPVYRGHGVAEGGPIDVQENAFVFDVEKSRIGSPRNGDKAVGFYVTSVIGPAGDATRVLSDRAPDQGVGGNYTFQGASIATATVSSAPSAAPSTAPREPPPATDVAEPMVQPVPSESPSPAAAAPMSWGGAAKTPGPATVWVIAALVGATVMNRARS